MDKKLIILIVYINTNGFSTRLNDIHEQIKHAYDG